MTTHRARAWIRWGVSNETSGGVRKVVRRLRCTNYLDLWQVHERHVAIVRHGVTIPRAFPLRGPLS
jgi:hypothetical protein